MQAAAVAPSISNCKNDSNSMTTQNSRNASISRNESNDRKANAVGKPAKAGMIAKVVKTTRAGRPTTAGTLLTSEMTAAAGILGTSWMSTAAEAPESDSSGMSATMEKTAKFSRDASSRSRISQLEH
jgi:hypothetical protein